MRVCEAEGPLYPLYPCLDASPFLFVSFFEGRLSENSAAAFFLIIFQTQMTSCRILPEKGRWQTLLSWVQQYAFVLNYASI